MNIEFKYYQIKILKNQNKIIRNSFQSFANEAIDFEKLAVTAYIVS